MSPPQSKMSKAQSASLMAAELIHAAKVSFACQLKVTAASCLRRTGQQVESGSKLPHSKKASFCSDVFAVCNRVKQKILRRALEVWRDVLAYRNKGEFVLGLWQETTRVFVAGWRSSLGLGMFQIVWRAGPDGHS
jgi:hypothetical protein